MKIAYTSDLHIDASEGNRDAVARIADAIEKLRPDVVVVAGDAGNTIQDLKHALSHFSGIAGRKFFVPGNHDVWIENDAGLLIDSRGKYAERIPDACRKTGFHDLGHEPVVIGGAGFVGSLGWYDYSFADPLLGLGEDDYWRGRYGDEIWWDKKMTYWVAATSTHPSSAAGPGESASDLKSGADAPNARPNANASRRSGAPSCPSTSHAGASRGRMRDPAVCAEMSDLLEKHILSIEERVSTIVAVIHTLPFFVGIPRTDPPNYLDAFTGSGRLGRIILSHAKVAHCIHGHKHSSGEWTVGRIRVCRRTIGRIDSDTDVDERIGGAIGVLEI